MSVNTLTMVFLDYLRSPLLSQSHHLEKDRIRNLLKLIRVLSIWKTLLILRAAGNVGKNHSSRAGFSALLNDLAVSQCGSMQHKHSGAGSRLCVLLFVLLTSYCKGIEAITCVGHRPGKFASKQCLRLERNSNPNQHASSKSARSLRSGRDLLVCWQYS